MQLPQWLCIYTLYTPPRVLHFSALVVSSRVLVYKFLAMAMDTALPVFQQIERAVFAEAKTLGSFFNWLHIVFYVFPHSQQLL